MKMLRLAFLAASFFPKHDEHEARDQQVIMIDSHVGLAFSWTKSPAYLNASHTNIFLNTPFLI